MPILALHPAEADRLYELIGYPSAWDGETEEVHVALQKLLLDTTIRDQQLFKKVGQQYLPYVRPSLRLSLILQAHRDTGHGGIAKTHDWLQKHYYWENLRLLIPDVLASCHDCQLQRPRATAHEFKLVPPQHAFHTVSIDAVGPLPRSCSGCRFILVAVDHFSKWVEARPTKYITSKTTAAFFLQDIFYHHRYPQVLLSDNGSNFNARLVVVNGHIQTLSILPVVGSNHGLASNPLMFDFAMQNCSSSINGLVSIFPSQPFSLVDCPSTYVGGG